MQNSEELDDKIQQEIDELEMKLSRLVGVDVSIEHRRISIPFIGADSLIEDLFDIIAEEELLGTRNIAMGLNHSQLQGFYQAFQFGWLWRGVQEAGKDCVICKIRDDVRDMLYPISTPADGKEITTDA